MYSSASVSRTVCRVTNSRRTTSAMYDGNSVSVTGLSSSALASAPILYPPRSFQATITNPTSGEVCSAIFRAFRSNFSARGPSTSRRRTRTSAPPPFIRTRPMRQCEIKTSSQHASPLAASDPSSHAATDPAAPLCQQEQQDAPHPDRHHPKLPAPAPAPDHLPSTFSQKKNPEPQSAIQKDFRGQEGGTHTTRPFSPRGVAAHRGQVEATPGLSFMRLIVPSLV